MAIRDGQGNAEGVDMSEFRYAKGRIPDSLQFISREIKEFDKDYACITQEDYKNDIKIQKLIDRTVENILIALIEISGTVITQKGIAVESYGQALEECAKLFGFSKDEQKSLSKLALQRSRLAHRYLNFRWQAVAMFKELKGLILKLLARVLEGVD